MSDDAKHPLMVFVFIFIIIFVGGYLLASYMPSVNKTVYVDYKFKRENDCYIVGTTVVDNKKELDLYKVAAQYYDDLEEGSEYSISTTHFNFWNNIGKTIYDFKIKGEETND